MYKNVVFDVGGVILRINGHGSHVAGELSQILRIPMDTSLRFYEQDRPDLIMGKKAPIEFLDKMIRELNLPVDPNKALADWMDLHSIKEENLDWDLLALVALLRKTYKTYILSDTLPLDVYRRPTAVRMDSYFDGIFRSHEQHLKKPNEDAYLNLLRQTGALPAECVFVDDHAPNVAAAEKVGMKALLFVGTEQLKAQFAELGLLRR